MRPSAQNMPNREIDKALSLLGMARRAGAVEVGQDRVLGALKISRQLVVATGDCSPVVLRKVANLSVKRESVCYILEEVTREELGRALGVTSAQVAALPFKSGFVNKLAELLQQGGRCLDEQNEGV